LTLAAEHVAGWTDESADLPSGLPIRPSQWVPGTPLALIEQERGSSYPLKVGLNTIGRFPENDIVLEEIEISRRHCVILVHVRGNCEIHDTASMNGTFVNGLRIRKPVSLEPGDQIRICDRHFFLAGDRADEPAIDHDFPPTIVLE
jgi:pSer/pThr/pTyr-binding forkhead associated (FHA) protein